VHGVSVLQVLASLFHLLALGTPIVVSVEDVGLTFIRSLTTSTGTSSRRCAVIAPERTSWGDRDDGHLEAFARSIASQSSGFRSWGHSRYRHGRVRV